MKKTPTSLLYILLFSLLYSQWTSIYKECTAPKTSSASFPLAEYSSTGVREQIEWATPKIRVSLYDNL